MKIQKIPVDKSFEMAFYTGVEQMKVMHVQFMKQALQAPCRWMVVARRDSIRLGIVVFEF
ncbi:MAG: hypothetical protein KGJ88_12820 [Verrucomicrobiota bacterium]|nr:hypothetical protein [Verrucomicrobiota bacterium]